MALGPIEVVVIAFPGSRFDGAILPELERLLQAGTISIVDGLLASKDVTGETSFVEIDEVGPDDGPDGAPDVGENEDVSRLAALCDRFDELLSDDDVDALTADLDPGSSAAILVFEHTWVRPLRDAIAGAGGVLAANVRIPREAVSEVMTALESVE